MDGAVIAILAAVTAVGSLNVATVVLVINIAKEVGALGARVVHFEQGQAAMEQRLTGIEQGQTAMEQRLTGIEQRLTAIEKGITQRVVDLEVGMKQGSDEIHGLAKETRRFGLLVAKALDVSPDVRDGD